MAKQTATDEATASKRSRRDLLTGAAGALGAVAAQSLVREQAALAADGDPVILGSKFNQATLPTEIRNNGVAEGLIAYAGVNGAGVAGAGGPITESGPRAGAGVLGIGTGSGGGNGVEGEGGFNSGTGVLGTGGPDNGDGVVGKAAGTGNGVVGVGGSDGGKGVVAQGGSNSGTASFAQGGDPNGFGVDGVGAGSGFGVRGRSASSSGIGAVAENTGGGAALEVNGPAVFSRSGRVIVPAGSKNATVKGVPLTSGSLVLAMVQQASSRAVRTAVPDPDMSSIAITLTAAADVDTTLGWFVVN